MVHLDCQDVYVRMGWSIRNEGGAAIAEGLIRVIIVGKADDAARARREGVSVRRFASSAEADAHDLDYWSQLSDAERVLQVWRLSQKAGSCTAALPMNPDFVDLFGISAWQRLSTAASNVRQPSQGKGPALDAVNTSSSDSRSSMSLI